jgi:cyclophilin family peptidyl-prolyl cis-trans isomerase
MITMIRIETTHGDMTIELFEKDAPLTVANFLQYVDDGHYDGTIFHRVIPGFMIQGGGMDAGFGERKTRAPIKNEADNGQQNLRGNLSMARTNAPHSATSQFFINLKDNDFLDYRPGNHGYAVFGRVTAGMDVVDAIAAVRTGTRKGYADAPLDEVVIKKASRIDPKSTK